MGLIVASVLSMGALSVFFGVMLSFAHKKFKVEEDPRVEQVLEALPGVNCGACGFASCQVLAEAIVERSAGANSCVAGGSEAVEKISQIMGVEAEKAEEKLAFVRCGVGGSERKKKAVYQGVETCRAASLVMGADTACFYGCLGFSDCQKICSFGAIEMINGLPHINSSLCTGCGKCVEICPRNIIVLESFNDLNYLLKCSSLDSGKKARKVCHKACIACGRCVKFCPYEACSLENNLARIDSKNCQLCGICYLVCPTGAIIEIEKG